MIAIVSSMPRERAALAALCGLREWPIIECDSLRSFIRLIHRITPKVAVIRHRLDTGFSDDALAGLAQLNLLPATKVIVLLPAGAPSAVEVRQLGLGADWTPRDPVRTDVLLAYINKYLKTSVRQKPSLAAARAVTFCGASLSGADRSLTYRGKTVALTPREFSLVERLVHAGGNVLTYDELYTEILERRFGGDTSNMRVLLRKLSVSLEKLNLKLGDWVTVIPKTGYRYTP